MRIFVSVYVIIIGQGSVFGFGLWFGLWFGLGFGLRFGIRFGFGFGFGISLKAESKISNGF